ncbi:MAG TPA: universal stress protein [Acidimicrobiales bacterium]|nr:universal stress protein [Acidimicrobiales bacterium]
MTNGEGKAGQRIVVGFDGSEPSMDAMRWAAGYAELTGSGLEVVMMWEWPTNYGWTLPLPADYDPAADAQEVVSKAVELLRSPHPGLDVRWKVIEGHPAPTLVEQSRGADLLVVGSRGHGEFAGMLLGSVSEHCVAHAHCPVLVFRN